MNNNTQPHILGSKLIGEEQQAAQVLAITTPQLGDLARGLVADRNGRKLVVDEVVVIAHEETEDGDAIELAEGTLTLTISDSPEVQAAIAQLENVATVQIGGTPAPSSQAENGDTPSRTVQAAENKKAKGK